MRRSKEIVVLLALLLGAVAFVLWYVADRRSRQQAAPPAEPKVVGPVAPGASAPAPAPAAAAVPEQPVDLAKTDGQTVDFSSGKPVVKQSAEDQAAIAAAKKDMDAALSEVSFEPAKKPAPPKP